MLHKNSFELKEKLSEVDINGNHRLVSLYIKSLYTNVAIKIVNDEINDNCEMIRYQTIIKSTAMFIEEIKLCMDNELFRYKGEFCKQVYGEPMQQAGWDIHELHTK